MYDGYEHGFIRVVVMVWGYIIWVAIKYSDLRLSVNICVSLWGRSIERYSMSLCMGVRSTWSMFCIPKSLVASSIFPSRL